MLTNREVRDKAEHLQSCLQGYINGINAFEKRSPGGLDKAPQVHEPWYCELVKEIGEFLVVLGSVDPVE